MKILIIGGTGLIGSHLVKNFEVEHEVIKVGNQKGDFQVDLASKESIESLLNNVGRVDHIICAAGVANFGPLFDISDEDINQGIQNKLLGQVHLVRIGSKWLNDNGSITLTSGELSHNPMPGSSAISLVNAGLEAYVKAAALEMKNNQRVNIVCPPFLKETMDKIGMDSASALSAVNTIPSYKYSLTENINGLTIYPKDLK